MKAALTLFIITILNIPRATAQNYYIGSTHVQLDKQDRFIEIADTMLNIAKVNLYQKNNRYGDTINKFKITSSTIQELSLDNIHSKELSIDSSNITIINFDKFTSIKRIEVNHSSIQELIAEELYLNDTNYYFLIISSNIDHLSLKEFKNYSLSIYNSKIKNKSYFGSFHGYLESRNSHYDTLTIKDAYFEKYALFNDGNFNYLNIENSSTNGNFYFSNDTIKQWIYIANVTCTDSSNIYFNNTTLPPYIFLWNLPYFKGEIDLSIADYTNVKEKIILSIGRNVPVERIKIDYQYFKLQFPNWMSVNDISHVYEVLLRTMQKNGHYKDYIQLDIEYQDFRWLTKWYYEWDIRDSTGEVIEEKYISFFYWIHVFPKYWNMYGHEKERIFGWTTFFIFLFTIITYFKYDTLTTQVYSFKNIPLQPSIKEIRNTPKRYKNKPFKRKKITNRLWYSFVYTSAIFFSLWLKIENLKLDNKKAVLYFMLMHLVGIVCIGYLADYVLEKNI